MRQKRENICQHCKAPVEPNYLFCLACGEELPLPESGELPPQPVGIIRKADSKPICWQCRATLMTPSPECPHCGAALDEQGEQAKQKKQRKQPKQKKVKESRAAGRRSWLRAAVFLLLVVLLAGAGAIVLAPTADETGSGGLSWSSLSAIKIPRIFGDDGASAGDKPERVAENASEARIDSVSDDGLIRIRIEGQEVDVHLAGTSPGFVEQCLGEKALARVRRILVDEAVVFVALDGAGAVSSSGQSAAQSVYIWQYDPDTGEVRFVNQELLGGGEVAYKPVKLAESELALALVEANERAQEKQRGRYEPGACD